MRGRTSWVWSGPGQAGLEVTAPVSLKGRVDTSLLAPAPFSCQCRLATAAAGGAFSVSPFQNSKRPWRRPSEATRQGTSNGSSSLCLRYLSRDRARGSERRGPGDGAGTQPQGGDLTTRPASFQGNRDESTSVDMSLVQRDAQVGVLARAPPGLPASGCAPPHFISFCF